MVLTLARDLDISREACARRWLELLDEPIALVFGQDGTVRYVERSPGFPFVTCQTGDRLPALPHPTDMTGPSNRDEADWRDWLARAQAGLTPIKEAQLAVHRRRPWRATQLRNGLMIALLALNPIRSKNFASLTLSKTFLRQGEKWCICLEARETKTGRADEREIAEVLNSAIALYVTQSRPVLLGCGEFTVGAAPQGQNDLCLWGRCGSARRANRSRKVPSSSRLHRRPRWSWGSGYDRMNSVAAQPRPQPITRATCLIWRLRCCSTAILA
jgi:hypothetical protein